MMLIVVIDPRDDYFCKYQIELVQPWLRWQHPQVWGKEVGSGTAQSCWTRLPLHEYKKVHHKAKAQTKPELSMYRYAKEI